MKRKELYVFYNPETKKSKIGISSNVYRRLRQIRCQSGCAVWCPFISDFDKHKEVKPWRDCKDTTITSYVELLEKQILKHFKYRRTFGEWFTLDWNIIVNFINRNYRIPNKAREVIKYAKNPFPPLPKIPYCLRCETFKDLMNYYFFEMQ